MPEKRNSKYYYRESTYFIYERDNIKYFILPLKFKFYLKDEIVDCYAKPFYEKLGLEFVEESIESQECICKIPEGWKLYEDNYNGYWFEVCDNNDNVVLSIFHKKQFWVIEDYFSRVDDDKIFDGISFFKYEEYLDYLKNKSNHKKTRNSSNKEKTF